MKWPQNCQYKFAVKAIKLASARTIGQGRPSSDPEIFTFTWLASDECNFNSSHHLCTITVSFLLLKFLHFVAISNRHKQAPRFPLFAVDAEYDSLVFIVSTL